MRSREDLVAMTDSSRHDAWQAGDSYDAYMGRWSRSIAPRFVQWLDMPIGLEWLEIGCGTGALSSAILAQAQPRSLICLDPSEGFLAKARNNVTDDRAEFRLGDAQSLDLDAASRDVIVSALVLNFVPDKSKALAEMRRVARAGATVAFYVWDYPGRGVEFMAQFWRAAAALDPKASDLSEEKRFPMCTPPGLEALVMAAGLEAVDIISIEIKTVFKDFDDYWRPFTMGAGPAPGYCASLDSAARDRLRTRLTETLTANPDGSIPLQARAWAVRAIAP
jgi:SAM-dependent methyltransferase